MKNIFRKIEKKTIVDNYSTELDNKQVEAFPSGHYYSPIVDIIYVQKNASKIWKEDYDKSINGINLNEQQQLDLTKKFIEYYGDLPFPKIKASKHRYYFENEFYSYTDAIFLYSMMRYFKPNNIIEIGSGFSSALMLDVNNLFFNNQINLTFIEPFTERLDTLLTTNDQKIPEILRKPIQNIDLEIFNKLEHNDFLFIDSTHVVKTGSDVHFILNEILPILKPGVIIHFHDIFYPFEYPKVWVLSGRSWNENYFVKAFLMYNTKFEIILFADYLHKFHKEVFNFLPLCNNNSGGNFWIRKIT